MNSAGKDVRISFYGRRIIYICPKCGKPITFTKKAMGKSLCLKCGQRLLWEPIEKLQTNVIQAEDAHQAAIIAEKYYQANEMNESDWFNLDEWRRSLHGKGCELYFLFKGPKEYGRFKRSMNGGKRT